MLFDAEANDGLARFGNAFNHLLCPTVLNTDHHDSGDVGIAARANECAEMQIQIGTKLQAAVRMWNRHHAFDAVRDGFGGGIRQIIDRQNDDVVTYADATVLAPVAPKRAVLINH